MPFSVDANIEAVLTQLATDIEAALGTGVQGPSLSIDAGAFAQLTDAGLKTKIIDGWRLALAALMKSWPIAGAWTAPTFQNSWANAAGYTTTAFRQEGQRVFLRGTISGGTNSIAFNIPAPLRPSAKVRMHAGTAVIEVDAAGNVTITGSGTVGLDGLSYGL